MQRRLGDLLNMAPTFSSYIKLAHNNMTNSIIIVDRPLQYIYEVTSDFFNFMFIWQTKDNKLFGVKFFYAKALSKILGSC